MGDLLEVKRVKVALGLQIERFLLKVVPVVARLPRSLDLRIAGNLGNPSIVRHVNVVIATGPQRDADDVGQATRERRSAL